MRSLFLLSICSSVFCLEPTFKEPEIFPSDSHGKYLIKFKDASSVVKASSFVKAQAAQVSPMTIASISSAQGVDPDNLQYGISSTYNATFINAIAVNLSEDDIKKVKKRYGDRIEYIEPNLKAYATGTQVNAPWGLARVGQWVGAPGVKNYQYPDAAGQGVDVYILDTGLVPSHPSFEGRAKFVQNFVKGSSNGDVVGHGTHVAGTVGSSKFGVAKKANIYGIKVLGDQGNGDFSGMIEALQYVVKNAKPGKTVVNMSLAGGKAQILEEAIKAARKAGVLVVVAAGNNRQDACNYSPASSPHALTVGATDQNDNTASFSNFGKCVDVFAPGVSIDSLGKGGNDDVANMQGTSMASPHVAGIAALYMSIKNYRSADDVARDIMGWSRRCVKGAGQGSGLGLVYANASLK